MCMCNDGTYRCPGCGDEYKKMKRVCRNCQECPDCCGCERPDFIDADLFIEELEEM